MLDNNTIYRTASEINSGMVRVYGHMMLAILTSMLVSIFVSSSTVLMTFFFTGIMKWITVFAPLVAVFLITYKLNSNPSKSLATILLHVFAALMGLSFSAIFVVYTGMSIVSAFLSGALLFGIMGFYGYFTNKSLDSWFQFLFIGLIAVIIVSVINIFLGSSVLTMVISACSLLVFLGLTAYDTQKIREMLSYNDSETTEIRGALTLYLDFINIFLSILQLFGNKE